MAVSPTTRPVLLPAAVWLLPATRSTSPPASKVRRRRAASCSARVPQPWSMARYSSSGAVPSRSRTHPRAHTLGSRGRSSRTAVSTATDIDITLCRSGPVGGRLLEYPPERAQRVVDPGLCGTDRDPELVRDLGEAAPAQVHLDQDLPAVRAQPGQPLSPRQRGDPP